MPASPPRPWYRKLHWQIAAGMVLGVVLGALGRKAAIPYYDWLGDVFLRLLKMVVVPLVVSSIIMGVARLGDARQVGRLGLWTLLYYIATSGVAIVTGLVLVNVIQPGVGAELGLGEQAAAAAPHDVGIRELLLGIVPENPLGEAARFAIDPSGGAGLIGVIFFSAIFGMASAALPERHRQNLLGFFEAVFRAMMIITNGVIRFAPIGVAALVGRVVGETGLAALQPLVGYMLTVLLGLALHFFVTIPLVLRFLARRSPYAYMRDVGLALTTAFTTASSNATLPVSLEVAQDKAGVDGRVAGFVLPLGATVNMDGSALYEGIAAVFVAQAVGRHLGLDEQILLFVTVLLASVGAAGIPHGSLVMLTVIFDMLGLPLAAVGALVAVDRILTMCRTATNIWGDLAGAAVVARWAGGASDDAPPEPEEPPS